MFETFITCAVRKWANKSADRAFVDYYALKTFSGQRKLKTLILLMQREVQHASKRAFQKQSRDWFLRS